MTSTSAETLRHFLAVAGGGRALVNCLVRIFGPDAAPGAALDAARAGAVAVLVAPTSDQLAVFGARRGVPVPAPWRGDAAGTTLRGLVDAATIEGEGLMPVLQTSVGPLWALAKEGAGGALLCGADPAAAIVRLRQGDPDARPTAADLFMDGYAGERPNYLFHDVLNPEHPSDRPADVLLFSFA
ncbi:MAG: hypothetical protein K2Q06_13430, partial [Parvularculaceae bacterium]|nr:hypothetical protein [Parvularculaceae bacterium]